jgi:hypothetical protein
MNPIALLIAGVGLILVGLLASGEKKDPAPPAIPAPPAPPVVPPVPPVPPEPKP